MEQITIDKGDYVSTLQYNSFDAHIRVLYPVSGRNGSDILCKNPCLGIDPESLEERRGVKMSPDVAGHEDDDKETKQDRDPDRSYLQRMN